MALYRAKKENDGDGNGKNQYSMYIGKYNIGCHAYIDHSRREFYVY
jgi:hypothetical protein